MVASPKYHSLQVLIQNLTIVTVSGAFDEAVKGCHAISHMASPVSLSFRDPEPIIRTAIQGTISILNSAIDTPSIKSVVLISSIGAIMGAKAPPYAYNEADWNDVSEDVVAELGREAPGPHIYLASKTTGEKVFWKFMDECNPSFSRTAINPVFVGGPPLVVPKSPDESKWIDIIRAHTREPNHVPSGDCLTIGCC